MTRWVVVREEEGRPGWSVQKVDQDGKVSYPRNRWCGISCIDAQVIAAELNSAYAEGMREGMQLGDIVFGQPLGD